MDTQSVLKWMQLFSEKIQENKDYLSQLDSPIGDGDHGGNMARGMAAVMDELKDKDFSSPDQIFKIVAMQLLSKVGGASGPLYGSAFMGLTKASQTQASLVECLQAGLDMIQKRGKAEQGEKTMVDVWIPVIKTLESQELTPQLIQEFVQTTKDIQATKGRANSLFAKGGLYRSEL